MRNTGNAATGMKKQKSLVICATVKDIPKKNISLKWYRMDGNANSRKRN